MSIENFKKIIEEKYTKIIESDIGYSAKDIREVFLPYIKNKEKFLQLSDIEILNFFNSWYEQNLDQFVFEIEKPDIE